MFAAGGGGCGLTRARGPRRRQEADMESDRIAESSAARNPFPRAPVEDPDHAGAELRVERRSLLWIPVAAAGAHLCAGTSSAAAAAPSKWTGMGRELAAIDWSEFAQRWQALAKELQDESADHDARYATLLAAHLARVPLEALPKLEKGNTRAGITAGPSWFLAPVVTVEFRMEPHAVLRLHNHPPQVVVTLCAEGEARYRHFEIEGDAPACDSGSKGTFRVRETRAGLLRPGQSTALTRLRDGIHGFEAGPRGARVIDFTLGLSESEAFSYVGLEPAPRDPERRVHDAVWLGKD
jgi:hypothetical protein